MLDKKSKKLLKYLEGKSSTASDGFVWFETIWEEYPQLSKQNLALVKANIRHLIESGYLERVKTAVSGSNIGVSLTHVGNNRRSFVWIDFKNYLLNHWVSILALVISIISLLISLKIIPVTTMPAAPAP